MTRLAAVRKAPAVQAALIQLLACALTLLLAYLTAEFSHLHFTLLTGALAQGAIAAALTRLRGLAPWWVAIGFLFAPALLLTLALRLPPLLFCAAFLFFLLLYWSTFRTQVPFYPSGPKLWAAVAALLPPEPLRVVDIGSGLGGFALDLARRRPDCALLGVELAPLPWLVSRLRAAGGPPNVRFVLADYERLDFATFDVVFAYLSPAAMAALARKADAEMRPGTLLLSYEFPIPGRPPSLEIVLDGSARRLFGWRL